MGLYDLGCVYVPFPGFRSATTTASLHALGKQATRSHLFARASKIPGDGCFAYVCS